MVNLGSSSDDMSTETGSNPMLPRTLNIGNSVLTMPLAGARAAPKKFTGKYSKIRGFILHYELLLAQHNILRNTDRCELITRYCSTKVTEFIQALSSYNDKDWDALREDLLKYYDADLDSKKYRVPDLAKFAKQSKDKKIRNLSAWREYGRKFITIGGWLVKKKKITDHEYATLYWSGIPRNLRGKIENRLLAADPARSLVNPFKVSEINKAAEGLLQRDRFDSQYNESDDNSDSEVEEDSDSESSNDSEDELRRLRRRIKKKAKYQKKARFSVSESDSDSSEDENPQVKQKTAKNIKKKVELKV